MEKSHFRNLLKNVYKKSIDDYQRKFDYRTTFNLPKDDIIKYDPQLYGCISQYDDSDDDKSINIIYNINKIIFNESDYLDDWDNESTDSSSNESDNLQVLKECNGYFHISNKNDEMDLLSVPNNNLSANRRVLQENNRSLHTKDNIHAKSVFLEPNANLIKSTENNDPDHANENDDAMNVFTEPNEMKTSSLLVVELNSWFPLFVNGVCRFIGKLNSGRNNRIVGIVTEPVFEYNEFEIVTSRCRYKLNGNMDTSYLPDNNIENIPILSKDNWLKSSIILSKMAKFGNKELKEIKLNCLTKKQIVKYKISQLCCTKLYKIIKHKRKRRLEYENVEIRSQLEDILKMCQDGREWQCTFQQWLSKCSQNCIVSKDIFEEPNVTKRICKNVDMDEPDSYDEFLCQGDIFNSTINNSYENLYLWSVFKNENGKLCLTGLIKCGEKYIEVTANPIKYVSSDGTCVWIEKERYMLIGPLYKLSLYCCYPNTENYGYLDLFQNYFVHGLPKIWKSLVTMIHIMCVKCSQLRINNPLIIIEDCNVTKEITQTNVKTKEDVTETVIDVTTVLENSLNHLHTFEKPGTSKLETVLAIKKRKPSHKVKGSQMKSHKVTKSQMKKTRPPKLSLKQSDLMSFDRSIHVSHRALSNTPDTKHRSLIIQNLNIDPSYDLIYQPTIGFPVDLRKLPITRSGRMSLPPPDYLSDTRFEIVGDSVHFVSDSVTKMIFKA